MSNDLMEFLGKQATRFEKANGWGLKWEEECLFARQQVLKNDYVLKAAQRNPGSLQSAILNVAAIGISLNPASAHAYLVPRDGSICLDVSYKGMVKLATDCGAVKDCKTVLVYEADGFEWNGPYEMPSHKADPFLKAEERGEVKGAYNIAFLTDGRVMVDTMSRAELDKVRSTSKAQNGPWKTWPEEMMKKTMTKRAYKSWPQTENRARLDQAVQVSHEAEGTAFTFEEQARYMELLRSGDEMAFFLNLQTLSESAQIALFNSFDDGHKVKDKKLAAELEKAALIKLSGYSDEVADMIQREARDEIEQFKAECSEQEWKLITGYLSEPELLLLDAA